MQTSYFVTAASKSFLPLLAWFLSCVASAQTAWLEPPSITCDANGHRILQMQLTNVITPGLACSTTNALTTDSPPDQCFAFPWGDFGTWEYQDCDQDPRYPELAMVSLGASDSAVLSRGADAALHFHHAGIDKVVAPNRIASAPAAVSLNSSHIAAFVRGIDGQPYVNTWNGSSWSGYQGLKAKIVGTPVAVALGSTIHLFVLGTDKAVWTKFFDGTTWSDYQQIAPTAIVGTPIPVVHSGSIEVFAKRSDGKLYSSSGVPSSLGMSWSGYTLFANAPFKGRASVVARSGGGVQAFVRAMDDSLATKVRTTPLNSATVGGYAFLSSIALAADPVAVAFSAGRISVVLHLATGGLAARHFDGLSWNTLVSLAPNAVRGRPAATASASSTAIVATRGIDDFVYGISYHPAIGSAGWYDPLY